jgi:hypothetical protein
VGENVLHSPGREQIPDSSSDSKQSQAERGQSPVRLPMKAHNSLLQGWCSRFTEERLLLATLIMVGMPIFLLGLGTPVLYDPHESLYAEIAREVLVRGDWLTPHLNNTRYLDKPPLLYW